MTQQIQVATDTGVTRVSTDFEVSKDNWILVTVEKGEVYDDVALGQVITVLGIIRVYVIEFGKDTEVTYTIVMKVENTENTPDMVHIPNWNQVQTMDWDIFLRNIGGRYYIKR